MKKSTKKPAPLERSWDNPQRKEKSRTRRLDMSKFALPKVKRPSNLWAPLPTIKATSPLTTNTTSRNTSPKIDTTTNPTITSTCRTCKRWGLSCPFCTKSAPHPSPKESNWSDKDWDSDRPRPRGVV